MERRSARPRLVGQYIRNRREELKMSQRTLGQLFTPPVTTQFISNVERGVTPLPPNHVAILAKALKINETELMSVLEQEYAAKLSNRLGVGQMEGAVAPQGTNFTRVEVHPADFDFFKRLYEKFAGAEDGLKQAFQQTAKTLFKF